MYNTLDKDSDSENYEANFKLGVALLEGNGIEQDIDKGFGLIKKSAIGGYVFALSKIGDLALEGKIIEQNADIAIKAYLAAAREGKPDGDPHAQNMCASYYSATEDFKRALEYHTYAARGGNIDSMRSLGFFYRDGTAGITDLAKSLQYFKQAADLGDKTSQYIIGGYYVFGFRGVKQDLDKAIKYIKAAVDNGYEDEDNLLSKAIELKNNPALLEHAAKLGEDTDLADKNKTTQNSTKSEQTKFETSAPKTNKLKAVFKIIGSFVVIAVCIIILVRFL